MLVGVAERVKRRHRGADKPTVTSLSVSKPSSFTVSVNGKPASPARVGWAMAMAFFLGIIIFYAASARFFSGQKVADLELQTANVLSLPGLAITQSGPRASEVGPVALDPSMNQVVLILRVAHPRMSSMEQLSCAITVHDASGHAIWQDDRVIASGRIGKSAAASGAYSTTSALFGTFDVPREEQYTFDVHFTAHYGDPVKSATLEVRRNTTGASPTVIAIGLGLALLCFVGFVRAKSSLVSAAATVSAGQQAA